VQTLEPRDERILAAGAFSVYKCTSRAPLNRLFKYAFDHTDTIKNVVKKLQKCLEFCGAKQINQSINQSCLNSRAISDKQV